MAKITVIPQTINRVSGIPLRGKAKLKVCGYARVSTLSEEQATSYEAQLDYYENYIKKRDDWEFVKLYSDEGISGTNTKRRVGFNTMIQDALDGKINMIITKSVSRFARNTVDSLTTIRKLKEHNVAVYFEEQNINTLDSSGELLLSIMSSIAQEESRNISENVKWGQRKRFSDGKVSMPFKHFLGYKKGVDGKPEIDEEQAKVVRRIYSSFLKGNSLRHIAKELMEDRVPTPGGKTKWQEKVIESILTNEKYKGDALLQKTFIVDFLQKKKKVNEGEVPQYYVSDSHPAIIEPLEWDLVQTEMERRKNLGAKYTNRAQFSTKLKCSCCGGFYGQKVWHSNSEKYRTVIWQCNNKFNKDKEKCSTPNFRAETIEAMFLKAYDILHSNRKQVIDDCYAMIEVVSDTKELDSQIEKKHHAIEIIADHVKLLVQTNASQAQDQEKYKQKYDELNNEYQKFVKELDELISQKQAKLGKAKAIKMFIEKLKTQPTVLNEFDDVIWNTMVDTAVVNIDGSITFKFYGGKEIRVAVE